MKALIHPLKFLNLF